MSTPSVLPNFIYFWSVVENEWQSLNLFQPPIPENIFFSLFHFSTAQSIVKCSKRTEKQIAHQPFNPYETHKHIIEYNFLWGFLNTKKWNGKNFVTYFSPNFEYVRLQKSAFIVLKILVLCAFEKGSICSHNEKIIDAIFFSFSFATLIS